MDREGRFLDALRRAEEREYEAKMAQHQRAIDRLIKSENPADRLSGYAGASYASVEAYIENHIPQLNNPAWSMYGTGAIEATAIFRAVGGAEYIFPEYRVNISAGNIRCGGLAAWKWELTDEGKRHLRRRVEDYLRKTYTGRLIQVAALCEITI